MQRLPTPACEATVEVDEEAQTARLFVHGVDLGETIEAEHVDGVGPVAWPFGERTILLSWAAPGHYGGFDGGSTLWAVNCDAPTSKQVFLAMDGANFGHAAMTRDGKTLYFTGPRSVYALDLTTKQTRALTHPPVDNNCWVQPTGLVDTIVSFDADADTLVLSRGGPCGFEGDYEGETMFLDHPATPGEPRAAQPVFSVAVDAGGAWLAATRTGLWRSADHARWNKLVLPDEAIPYTIYPDPKRPGHLVVESLETGEEPGPVRGGWVYATSDGVRWKRLAFPEELYIGEGDTPDEHAPLSISIAIRGSTDHVILWGPKEPPEDAGMWETTDGGKTWREQPAVDPPARPTKARSINDVVLEPSSDGVLVSEPGRAKPRRVYPH